MLKNWIRDILKIQRTIFLISYQSKTKSCNKKRKNINKTSKLGIFILIELTSHFFNFEEIFI